MLFKDKVCIVTGAAVGLGRAFCEQLLKQGAFVRSRFVKKFINRLSFFRRSQSSILTPTLASYVVSGFSNNLAKTE